MLSLSPRYDLFRVLLPREFIPVEISRKYTPLINREPQVIYTTIDYLNESIKGISFPGISQVNVIQRQTSSNPMKYKGLGGQEPTTDIIYPGSKNPLDTINKEFSIDFRVNQGLFNYFIIQETLFYRIMKDINYSERIDIPLQILSEKGQISAIVYFRDCHMDGLDGVNFSYDKLERQTETFSVQFKFNNIDVELIEK